MCVFMHAKDILFDGKVLVCQKEDNDSYMGVSLNCCSQNGGNLYRAPYYNRNLNIGPRIDSNLGQSPHERWRHGSLGLNMTESVSAFRLS